MPHTVPGGGWSQLELTDAKDPGFGWSRVTQIMGDKHPRPQAQARAALTVALGQAVDLRRNSDAEAWSHSICIPVAFLPKNMATAMNARKAYYKKQYILHLQKQIILKLS